jgi:DNA-binding GntR family transcriptional regulator
LLRKEYGHEPRSAEEFVAPVVAGGAEAALLDVAPGTPLLQVERPHRGDPGPRRAAPGVAR